MLFFSPTGIIQSSDAQEQSSPGVESQEDDLDGGIQNLLPKQRELKPQMPS